MAQKLLTLSLNTPSALRHSTLDCRPQLKWEAGSGSGTFIFRYFCEAQIHENFHDCICKQNRSVPRLCMCVYPRAILCPFVRASPSAGRLLLGQWSLKWTSELLGSVFLDPAIEKQDPQDLPRPTCWVMPSAVPGAHVLCIPYHLAPNACCCIGNICMSRRRGGGG